MLRLDPIRDQDLTQGGEVEVVERDEGWGSHREDDDKIGRDARWSNGADNSTCRPTSREETTGQTL